MKILFPEGERFFGLRPQNDTDVILSKAKDLVGLKMKGFFGLRSQNDIDVILSGRTRAGGTHVCAPSIDQAAARSEGSCGRKMKGFFGLRPQNDIDVILSKAKDLVGRKKNNRS